MSEWARNTRTYTQRELSREEKEQQAAKEIGLGYMRGTHSLQDVTAYLNGFHWPMTYSEVKQWIKKGADEAILESEVYTYPGAAVVESRKQPTQDKAELATIYARHIVKKNWDNKPLHEKVVIARLTKEQSEEFNSDRYRRVQLEFVKRSN